MNFAAFFLIFLLQGSGDGASEPHDYVGWTIGIVAFLVATGFAIKQYRDAKAAKEDAADAKTALTGTRGELAATRADLTEANRILSATAKQLADVQDRQLTDKAESQQRHDEQMSVLEHQRDQLQMQANQLEDQAKQLRDAALNKPVARFPDNIDALANFILRTQYEVRIMTDSLGYALYSNPEGHRRYIQAIETVIKRGCKVHLLLYSLDTLRAAVAQQIPPGENNDKWEVERVSDRCIAFFKRPDLVPKSYQEFRDILLTKEQELMSQLCALSKAPDDENLQVRVMNRRFSAFCWVRDDAEPNTPQLAMFAFRNDGMGEGGITFSTTDMEMVANFKEVFKTEFKKGDVPIYKNRW